MSQTEMPVWDLSLLCATREAALQAPWAQWEEELRGLVQSAQALSKHTPHEELASLLAKYDSLANHMESLRAYAYLSFAQDVTSPKNGTFFQNIREKLIPLDALSTELNVYIARCDEEYIRQASIHKSMHFYTQWFQRIMRQKPYMLSPEVETQWVERNVVAGDAWKRLAQETLGKATVEIDGKTITFNDAYNQLRDVDAEKRQKALDGLLKTLQAMVPLQTTTFNAIVKDQVIAQKWRGYDDHDAAMHQLNEVDAVWVDTLRSCVRASYAKTSHALLALRADKKGEKTINVSDIHAHLVPSDMDIPWEQALEWIIEAYHAFSPDLGALIRTFVQEGRFDLALKPGKEGGAFCYGTPKGPFVLVNYHGKIKDFLTLAHEIGHALHHALSTHIPASTRFTSLILAEVASLFSEKLCIEYVMQKVGDKDLSAGCFATYVHEQILCIQGSISYDAFEKSMHQQRNTTELSVDILQKAWLKARGECFGDRVHMPEGYGHLWSAIPHFFHTPFYVYAYAFSGLIVHNMYQKKEGTNFARQYQNFLSQGGCISFEQLRDMFGFSHEPEVFFKEALTSLYTDVSMLLTMVRENT